MSSVSEQAKSGFKTFILTFAGALLVFGAFYYVVSDSSVDDVSIEDESSTIGYIKTTGEDVEGVSDEAVIGEEVTVEEEVNVVGPVLVDEVVEDGTPSPFGELVKKEVDVAPRVVLAGAAESTESTVPDTGVAGMTIGLVVSIALFALFAYIVFINPRRYALSKFERDVLDDLK